MRRKRSIAGGLDSDLRQPFVNVFDLFDPKAARACQIRRIVRQQVSRNVSDANRSPPAFVMIASNSFGRKLIDVSPRQTLRQFPFAVVRVKRAAAVLLAAA